MNENKETVQTLQMLAKELFEKYKERCISVGIKNSRAIGYLASNGAISATRTKESYYWLIHEYSFLSLLEMRENEPNYEVINE